MDNVGSSALWLSGWSAGVAEAKQPALAAGNNAVARWSERGELLQFLGELALTAPRDILRAVVREDLGGHAVGGDRARTTSITNGVDWLPCRP